MSQAPISAPFPRILRVLAILWPSLVALAVITNLHHPAHMDFLSFWAAAVLTLQGHPADAYSPELLSLIQRQAVEIGTGMAFAYPPPFLLLILPIGLFSYGIAAIMWVSISYGAYYLVARRLMPGFDTAIAAFPPVLTCGILGQSSMLLGSFALLAFSILPAMPFAAGLLLGCLIMKPQLGVLVPLVLIASFNWKALIGAATSAIGLLAVAFILFGYEPYRAFLAFIPQTSAIVSEGLVGWDKMAGVFPALRLIGFSNAAAWIAHITIALAAAGAACWIWGRYSDPLLRGAAFSAATMLISPYLYQYDAMMLIMAFAWLTIRQTPVFLLAALWMIILFGVIQNWLPAMPVNMAPLASIGLMLMILRYRPAHDGKGAMSGGTNLRLAGTEKRRSRL